MVHWVGCQIHHIQFVASSVPIQVGSPDIQEPSLIYMFLGIAGDNHNCCLYEGCPPASNNMGEDICHSEEAINGVTILVAI